MRISFANVIVYYDFKTKEDAESFKNRNADKGWGFEKPEQFSTTPDAYGNMWTLVVHKPYRNYNMGY